MYMYDMYVDTDTCVYMCAHIWIMYMCIVHIRRYLISKHIIDKVGYI